MCYFWRYLTIMAKSNVTKEDDYFTDSIEFMSENEYKKWMTSKDESKKELARLDAFQERLSEVLIESKRTKTEVYDEPKQIDFEESKLLGNTSTPKKIHKLKSKPVRDLAIQRRAKLDYSSFAYNDRHPLYR